jgi:Flp pilus assembly protein TadD
VVEARPDDLDARNNLALALADAGRDLDRALVLAESVLETRPRDPSVMDTVGWVLLQKGEPEKALELFERALRRRPASPEINFHRAVAWIRTGQAARGRDELRRLQTSGVSEVLRKRIRRALAER